MAEVLFEYLRTYRVNVRVRTSHNGISLLIVLGIVLCGCQPKSIVGPAAEQTKAIVQGTIVYFEGGGTVEMIYPPGFILMSAQWISPPPDSSYGMIYLEGLVDSSYIDKHVRALGTAARSVLTGPGPGYRYAILTLKLDSLEVIK